MSAPSLSDTGRFYGAPLGRPARGDGGTAPRFYLRRVRLNSGGYDSTGAYWGLGRPLYWAASDKVDRFFRANDRTAAKAHLSTEFPGCTFHR